MIEEHGRNGIQKTSLRISTLMEECNSLGTKGDRLNLPRVSEGSHIAGLIIGKHMSIYR